MARYDFGVLAVVRVVDGDTLDASLDIGFRCVLTQRIRLANIDAPERRQVGHDAARLFLTDWLRERSAYLRTATYNEDSFGRWVGDVYDRRSGESASEALLRAGVVGMWR